MEYGACTCDGRFEAGASLEAPGCFDGRVGYFAKFTFKKGFSLFTCEDRVSFSATILVSRIIQDIGKCYLSFSGLLGNKNSGVDKGLTRSAVVSILLEFFDLPLDKKDEKSLRASHVPSFIRGWSCEAASPLYRSFFLPNLSLGEVREAGKEAVSMAPLKHRRSYFLDDGPRSDIWEESLERSGGNTKFFIQWR